MRVAIIADTHVNPSDDTNSSVYRVHANANQRVLSVVEKINSIGVDLVIHLGDFVHRIQGQPLRTEAIARFREIVGGLKAPLLLVPGNHDEGEKVTPWAPGHPVSVESLRQYRKDFGQDYFAKDVGPNRFICLNSQLFGAGDDEEERQYEFLRSALDTQKTKYVFQHHPFFLENPAEREHYDNLPENVRERYLPLFTESGVECVFAGHVHNYFFNIVRDTYLFVAPSTTFVRHDYTELFPFVPQGEAHGRNYASKLGFFVLDTDRGKNGVTWIRTFGCTDSANAAREIVIPRCNLFLGDRAAVGVDLRHDWATPRPIPYTALQDEFNRKHIRNDNFTASIIENAISILRVPIQDIEEEKPRKRIAELGRIGVRFVVFIYECPSARQVLLLNDAKEFIECVEICAPIERMDAVADGLRLSKLDRNLKLSFSQMGTSASATEAMAHYIWTGFDAKSERLAAHLQAVKARGFTSCVVRVERKVANPRLFERLAKSAAQAGLRLLVYARLASTNGAEAEDDDYANAEMVATLEMMGRLWSGELSIIVDTYADHDRGYYPRTGIVDRAYDPRLAARAISRITSVLGKSKTEAVDAANECVVFRLGDSIGMFIPRPCEEAALTSNSFEIGLGLVPRWKLHPLTSVLGEDHRVLSRDELRENLRQLSEPVLAIGGAD
jgi:predicted phosphodiesterase